MLLEEYRFRAAYMRLEVADGDGVAAKLYVDKGFERLDYQQMIKKL
jgi:adenylylsulfate kinase-like enzyme